MEPDTDSVETPTTHVVLVEFPNSTKVYEYRAFGVLSELQQCSHAVISRVEHTTNQGIESAHLRNELQLVSIVGFRKKQKYNGVLKHVVDTIDPTYYLKVTKDTSPL